jgi:hypothetical protein
MRPLLALLVLVATVPCMPAGAQDRPADHASWRQDGLERGREATRLLLAGDGDALAARFSPVFLAAVGGAAGVERLLVAVRESAGAEQGGGEEFVFREGGVTSYYRRSRFEKLPEVTIFFWAIDDAGTLQGGSVRPAQQPASSQHLDYQTKATLRLPFAAAPEGRWYVGWGGRDAIHNYHVVAPDQRRLPRGRWSGRSTGCPTTCRARWTAPTRSATTW